MVVANARQEDTSVFVSIVVKTNGRTSEKPGGRGRSIHVGGVEALVLHGCSDHGDGRRDAQYSQHQHHLLPHDHCWATTETCAQRRPFKRLLAQRPSYLGRS